MVNRGVTTWVKICGTTNLRDAELAFAAGADAMGFIFAPSARQVETAAAREIVRALPSGVETIGVFVNETPERVAEIVRQVGLSGVQLHGDESGAELAALQQQIVGRKMIKALSSRQLENKDKVTLERCLSRFEGVDAILLDSGSGQQRGGTGVPFDWERARSLASSLRERMPLIVAGGLTADNVAHAVELLAPFGVDVVSGVEREPGKKDEAKLRDFIAAVRGVRVSKT